MASDLPTGIGDQRQRPRSVVHAFLEMLTHGPSYGGLQEIGMLTLIEEREAMGVGPYGRSPLPSSWRA